MRAIEFVAYGDPIPKGSTTRLPNGVTLDGAPSRSKDKAKRKAANARRRAWPTIVRDAAHSACEEAALLLEVSSPLRGPLCVTATFYLARPKNETRAQRERIWHVYKPDIDKLLRGVLDPLKKAGAIAEDCEVSRVVVEKRYVKLPAPGHNPWTDTERPSAHVRVDVMPTSE